MGGSDGAQGARLAGRALHVASPPVLSKILGAIGRTLITAGTLILLFVAYQLWGTGLQEAKSQDQLAKEFDQKIEQVNQTSTTTTTAPATTTSTSTPDGTLEPVKPRTADLPLPEPGDAIAKIRIPAIGVTRTVVESVALSQLKRGPGHYPETPLPGQKGNVAIAGHRTTYGQPFHNIDKVRNGDDIIFQTDQGTFTYKVTGTIIVRPDQVEILEDKGDNRVTLIACHPKYSAAKRLIVIGELVNTPAPFKTGQDELRQEAGDSGDPLAEATVDGLSGGDASKAPAIWWGLAAAGVWLVTWLCQVAIRRTVRRRAEDDGEAPTRAQRLLAWSPYLVGLPVFLVVLYVFFENFARLLPGNY